MINIVTMRNGTVHIVGRRGIKTICAIYAQPFHYVPVLIVVAQDNGSVMNFPMSTVDCFGTLCDSDLELLSNS